MTETIERTFKPLHGTEVYRPKISTKSGEKVLAKCLYAMEFERIERVQTSGLDGYPGIKQVELFEAKGRGAGNESSSLEEAKSYNEHSMKFLISLVGNIAVVSSQIGYGESGAVEVPAPRNNICFPLEFALRGYRDHTDLRRRHVERLRRYGDSASDLPQIGADNIFRMMISGTKETD